MGAINISSVGKVYPNGTRALEDVNIEINDGEFVVLVGPSGCGKTTLLRMVAGLEDITEGEISIADKLVEIVHKKSVVIAGGGDTASALRNFKLVDNVSHVSTGGGASLELMSGNQLDAINKLEI